MSEQKESVNVNEGDFMRTRTIAPEMQKPFWQSRKFWYILLSILSMGLAGTAGGVAFSPADVVNFSLGVAGIGVGGHVVSDVMYSRKSPPTPPAE